MEQLLLISSIALWIFSLLHFLITLALIRRQNKAGSADFENAMNLPTLEPGKPAPDFMAETLDGAKKTLEDYVSKNIAFIFFSSTCKPCRDKLITLDKLQFKAQNAGIELLLVCLDDRLKTQAFMQEIGSSLPVLVAPMENNSFMNDYKVNVTPSFCLMDQHGNVQLAGVMDSKWDAVVAEWN